MSVSALGDTLAETSPKHRLVEPASDQLTEVVVIDEDVGPLPSDPAADSPEVGIDEAHSKLALWLLCGVGLGVLPVVANLITPLFTAEAFDLARPLSDGELLIAATAIAGGAVGELLQVRVPSLRAQMWINISGGFTILFCALCAFAYAVTKLSNGGPAINGSPGGAVPELSDSPNIDAAFGSIVLFSLTVVAATACVRLSASARATT